MFHTPAVCASLCVSECVCVCVRWPFIGRLRLIQQIHPVTFSPSFRLHKTHTHMRTQNNGWISPVFGNAVLIGSRLPGFAAGNRDVFVHG